MTQKIEVRPAEGVKVRTEDGRRHIDPKGEAVPATTYYRRRITAGDLIHVSEEKAVAGRGAAPADTDAKVATDTKKPAAKKKAD